MHEAHTHGSPWMYDLPYSGQGLTKALSGTGTPHRRFHTRPSGWPNRHIQSRCWKSQQQHPTELERTRRASTKVATGAKRRAPRTLSRQPLQAQELAAQRSNLSRPSRQQPAGADAARHEGPRQGLLHERTCASTQAKQPPKAPLLHGRRCVPHHRPLPTGGTTPTPRQPSLWDERTRRSHPTCGHNPHAASQTARSNTQGHRRHHHHCQKGKTKQRPTANKRGPTSGARGAATTALRTVRTLRARRSRHPLSPTWSCRKTDKSCRTNGGPGTTPATTTTAAARSAHTGRTIVSHKCSYRHMGTHPPGERADATQRLSRRCTRTQCHSRHPPTRGYTAQTEARAR